MRAIYLGVNKFYANPNFSLIPLLFGSAIETEYYGPGYSSSTELDRGLEYFLKVRPEFDFVVTDADTLFWSIFGNQVLKSAVIAFDQKFMKNFHTETLKYLRSGLSNVIVYTNCDYYHLPSRAIEILQEIEPILITRDAGFWSPISELEELRKEKFFPKANDNWFDYITKVPSKIISMPGVISESEFCYNPLEARKFDISIPGVQYFQRKIASEIASKLPFKVLKGEFRRKIISRSVQYTGSKMLQKLYQDTFVQSIEATKICFTCGSGLKYPLRKFLEIPARGGLLFCCPFNGFREFGFEDGVNAVVTDPFKMEDKLDYYLDNLQTAQEIARRGQDMILKKHSFSSRVIQLQKTLIRIHDAEFTGSVWDNGEYVLK